MRATLQRYLKAVQDRREQGKDEGFSLIELIVVVAILGILVAIAIPVFANIQGQASINALKTSAANAATQIAAGIAANPTVAQTEASIANLETDGVALTLDVAEVTPDNVGDFCVTATKAPTAAQTSGPGC